MKYIITGKVVKGDGYGKKIGFPTINLDGKSFSKLKIKPKIGVYSGTVKMSNAECLTYKAGIVIGPKIEAHLIDYSGNAYGKSVIFEINKFIRKFKKFKTEKELIMQIKKDLKICSQE